LALADLDNYYVHPTATLTIELTAVTHNIASNIVITNRGKSEGNLVIQGTTQAGTILTSSDFSAFDSGDGGFTGNISAFTMITLNNSKVKFYKVSITGPGGTTAVAGMDSANQSQLILENVNVSDFYNWNIMAYNQSYINGAELYVSGQ
jgi:hypothetical protein